MSIFSRIKGQFTKFVIRYLMGIALLFTMFSCVTNKKYQMLQKGDVNLSNLTADSVMRKYSVESFDYKVQTNDIISVRYESLSPKEYDFLATQPTVGSGNVQIGGALLMGDLVDENGEIPFPVVGKVKVTGLTVYEIQDKLQAMAAQYLDSPIVKVRLLNYRITFLGEVNREGVITLNNNRVNMLEAIGLAGGLSDLADKTNLKLIRLKNGQAEVIYLNLLDESFINSPYYYVYQNDVLIVPPLKQRPYRKYFGQNLALFLSAISILLVMLTYAKN